MSERSCPVSGSVRGTCPAGNHQTGPRGCSFSGFSQPGNLREAFDIPQGVDPEEWLRMRERKSINQLLYTNIPAPDMIDAAKTQVEVDAFNANEQDLLAVALGAPARQVMLRAEEIGPRTGWIDGYLSREHGFCPPDYDESAGALAKTPGRIWSDLCERMPGCVARGRVRESVTALPLVEATEENIPDQALWAAIVALGLLCYIYRFHDKYDGNEGVTSNRPKRTRPHCPMGDDLGEELVGIPLSIALPYHQVSRRMGRMLPHLTFVDQSSYNLKIKDTTSKYPYVARFDNMELRWPMFGEQAEIAFLKGVADTSASFQHGPDAIAACQEHVMNKNVEGLLREMIRLKEILERMPNAFHSISVNPNAGENYVSAQKWVRWAKFSAPLSKRCPASSGLQFPPYLVMDAFLGRKKYTSFLGAEGVHLRAWLPSNLRAFIASIEYHYRVPEFVEKTGDPRLIGVMDGIIEAYTGERGFMGVHRYKVFGILEVAGKTGRTETNGASGAADRSRPWEETHKQFSEAMKERLEPHRGTLEVEPHQMRVLSRSFVDSDPSRSVTFMPGDRLAVMPLNSWQECAKVAAALGLESMIDSEVEVKGTWSRFEHHLASVRRTKPQKLTIKDILRRGHLAPITKGIALKIHGLLRASSNTVLQVLGTDEWPIRGSLGDLLQSALMDTPTQIWDRAFSLDDISWLSDLIGLEVPRTYSIASYTEELLPSTVDLAVSRAEYKLCSTFAGNEDIPRAGVSSGFLNPWPSSEMADDEEVLFGVSRPAAFQLPLDTMAPCAFFAGGSGIAPFRSFWQSRFAKAGLSGGKNYLYLGVQSREKFCFEDELREYVNAGFIEVHLAFSRDSRGLAYDPYVHDLVERPTPPRYIDVLIQEQGATISELVMSKKQGGLGGYLYVCGSVSVFDSVMNGVRKAIYTHCTATMDKVDLIVNKAFAERRFMLDVFMTPKPLPCNLPTVPVSQLALHTGHRPGTRMWIGVHGSVYDVTDFCPMHPGGTMIIKSNAGGDCSESFDNLAHTNNPEVASLLTKYFVGHLTPEPDFHGDGDEITPLHGLWAAYLRSTVETLVAHQFEMYEIMGASANTPSSHDPAGTNNIWLQENLPSVIAVRTFYAYQSRLLQGGFAALFGPKLQELVLKLSFSLANASGPGAQTQVPDILGAIARAKTSIDAITCSKELALVGQLVSDQESSLRFQDRGVFAYASKSVELDIELLEDLRQEACNGMDAFDNIAATYTWPDGDGGPDPDFEANRLNALCTFLLQILDRMSRRLGVYYAQLAQLSIYHPELESNPARTRWTFVRRLIRDGSFFVLSHRMETNVLQNGQSAAPYVSRSHGNQSVGFDRVMSHVQASLVSSQQAAPHRQASPTNLNAVHQARGRSTGDATLVATRENVAAVRAMSTFVERNNRAIRRLSKLPGGTMSFDELRQTSEAIAQLALTSNQSLEGGGAIPISMTMQMPTPPQSRGPSRSRAHTAASAEVLLKLQRSRSGSRLGSRAGSPTGSVYYPVVRGQPPTPPLGPLPPHRQPSAQAALGAYMGQLNSRTRSSTAGPLENATPLARSVAGSMISRARSVSSGPRGHASVPSTTSLRTFRLKRLAEREHVVPTF
ncbi:cytochrome b5-like Heme/Steroid binding domain-containing protein [Xylaria palmicola]|nr:cytochrome b5-like Heme/Steroid binding domain-containing protein [Xylaria palmicola]